MHIYRINNKSTFIRCALIVSLILILVLTASCAGGQKQAADTPSGAVDTFFEAAKKGDREAIKEVYAGDPKTVTDITEEMGESSYKELGISEENVKEMQEKLLDFDYEVGEENVEGEKGTVKVKIKTYNTGAVFKKWLSEFMGWAMANAMSGMSQEELSKKGVEMFNDEFKNVKKDYSETVNVDVEKVDGKWKVSELNEESDILNALTGGMVDELKQLSENFSGLMENSGAGN